jgi:hypothetical protein
VRIASLFGVPVRRVPDTDGHPLFRLLPPGHPPIKSTESGVFHDVSSSCLRPTEP